jgi:hypothetical protein
MKVASKHFIPLDGRDWGGDGYNIFTLTPTPEYRQAGSPARGEGVYDVIY